MTAKMLQLKVGDSFPFEECQRETLNGLSQRLKRRLGMRFSLRGNRVTRLK